MKGQFASSVIPLVCALMGVVGCAPERQPGPETVRPKFSAAELSRSCTKGALTITATYSVPGTGEVQIVLLVDGQERAREKGTKGDSQKCTLVSSDLTAGEHDWLIRWEEVDGKEIGTLGPSKVRCE